MNHCARPIRLQRTSASRLRAGFTLVELLLVLAVMVLLAGIAYMTLSNAYGRRDLDTTVEEVRKELARTRNYAVDQALMYQFLYEPGGRHYVVVPYEVDTDLEARAGAAVHLEQRYPMVSRVLPKGFQFEAVGAQYGNTQTQLPYVAIPKQLADVLPNASDVSKLGPRFVAIVFQPDGSGEPASLIVKDDKSRSVTLTVRELTGSVSVGKLQQGRR